MNKFFKTLSIVSTLYSSFAFAQVKGVVTDESGLPLPGVSILIKGTQHGTQSNMDGQFEIDAKDGQTLVFSFVGMAPKEASATNTPMKISLNDDTQTLQEVVVTALGIKREKKALGYSQQEISGKEISESGQTNAISALSGNVSGIQVTAPSNMGGSTRILLRGAGSVTQNNKPLIIVDGIPFDNSNYNSTETQRGSGGRDYGDATADINPDDIASVTVLKGAAAAALYGSRAANGVIMYTTKTAKKGKSEVSLKQSLTLENAYILPNYQNEYGGGGQSTLPTAVINGKTYNIAQYAVDESWGPKYNPNLMYLPWNAYDAWDTKNYMVEKAWVAPKNDVKSFYNTGVTSNTNIGLSHATDKSNIRFSYGNQLTQGIVPNSELKKNNLTLNASTKITEKLKVDGVMTYTNTKGFNRPVIGYNNSVVTQFNSYGQRQLDYSELKDYLNPDGSQRTWNRTAWNNGLPKYADNPYWLIYKNTSKDVRDRIYGNVKLQYNFTDDLFAVANVYGDQYQFKTSERVAVGSQELSSYALTQNDRTEFNYEARLHYNKNWNNITLNSFVGTNRRKTYESALSAYTSGGLVIPDFYNVSNSVDPSRGSNSEKRLTINSIYAMASLGFYDMFYVEGTVRKDYFSTVKKAGVYPSVTGSFIFSQLLKDVEWLSFGKIRGGWAQVSNGANPYSLENYYAVGSPFNGIPTYGQSTTTNNPDLKPETKTSKEVGLEMRFFNNRFGFDVSYYHDVTSDLITPLQITTPTGFGYKYFNAGKMQNKGIEATVFVTPIQTEDFSWDINWNFSKNNNKLLELNGQSQTYTIGSAPFNASVIAMVGQKYGQIYGYDFQYDENGNKLISDSGTYLKSANQKTFGSVIPDYNMGIRNTFTYKGVKLSALIDVQKGGKYFSTSHIWGMYSGMLDGTTENGIRETGVVLEGIVKSTGQPNTKVIPARTYGQQYYYGPTAAMNTFDASYVKLREVTLGYTFPGKLFNNKVSSVSLNAYGRNLLTWGLAWKGMDPETASNGSGNIQGLEGGSLPATRTYGMSLEIKL